jgi:hypothetical protein
MKVFIQGNNLWIGGHKEDGTEGGIKRRLLLLKLDLNCNLLLSKSWRPYSNAHIDVRDLAVDKTGTVLVVGDTTSEESRSVIWKYNANGDLMSGYPQLFGGNVSALDSLGNIWRVADGIIEAFSGGPLIAGMEEPATEVEQVQAMLPNNFALYQNYPNPFNPSTDFRYEIRDLGWVSLKIYDILGREVETLVNGVKEPGSYVIKWNAINRPSGVYFCRMTAGQFVKTMKLLLVK